MTKDITFTETPLGTDQEAPKIEFPCLYPIKVIGASAPGFRAMAISVLERHAGDASRIAPHMQRVALQRG